MCIVQQRNLKKGKVIKALIINMIDVFLRISNAKTSVLGFIAMLALDHILV